MKQILIQILTGIALNLEIAFGTLAIFTFSILLTNEHGRAFHIQFFNFFLQCFIVSIIEVFKYFARLMLKYLTGFLYFEATVNGMVFLTSFSGSSFLAYRKATDFCM
jgi:hypothetical protein